MCGHTSVTKPCPLPGITSWPDRIFDSDNERSINTWEIFFSLSAAWVSLVSLPLSSAFSCTLKGRVGGVWNGVIDTVPIFPTKRCLELPVTGAPFLFKLQPPNFNFPFWNKVGLDVKRNIHHCLAKMKLFCGSSLLFVAATKLKGQGFLFVFFSCHKLTPGQAGYLG